MKLVAINILVSLIIDLVVGLLISRYGEKRLLMA